MAGSHLYMGTNPRAKASVSVSYTFKQGTVFHKEVENTLADSEDTPTLFKGLWEQTP